MAIDVSFASAFAAGAISFLSPCVLPLVPPYLCYMAGVSMDDFRGEPAIDKVNEDGSAAASGVAVRLPLMMAAVAFVAGFTTVFVSLGAGASTIGGFLRAYQTELAMAAGVVIILMGLNFLGILRISMFSREARFQAQGTPANPFAAYIMGLAFAFGWTPCIGPVLGPILTLAGARDSVGEGAALLAVYSAGLGIPFLVAAMFSGAFMGFLQRFRMHLGAVEKVIGGLLVLAGVLFLTGGMERMAFFLLERFPVLGTLG
ncbi:MAG: cytochrome c biogenesis CcdA family protein [Pseudomonadota bacterium]